MSAAGQGLLVLLGAVALTMLFFLVLPVMQQISEGKVPDTAVQKVAITDVPPPPVVEDEPEPPPVDESEPELEEAPPLDLASLTASLEGLGGSGPGVFIPNINPAAAAGGNLDEMVSFADLDQKPRAIYQPGPVISGQVRKRLGKKPATVFVVFIIGKSGRVEDARVQKTRDPVLDKAAVDAVKKWKFEPGKREGQPVRFRMRVPVTFPKG